MKRFILFTAIVTSAGCVTTDDEVAAFEQEVITDPEKCDPQYCGLNGGAFSDGGFFWELNLDGLVNTKGYSIVNARKNGLVYHLNVVNGRLSATGEALPITLTGTELVGLEIRLKRLVNAQLSFRTLRIEAVSQAAEYWAHPHPNNPWAPPTPKIETYRFFYFGDNSPIGAMLCQHGTAWQPTNGVTQMAQGHALLFEGERLDINTLRVVSSSNRWFNIGCAETVLAKLQLTGHTGAAASAGFATSIAERQTMLKMLAADYCGKGKSFTVAGQPLRWRDDQGTMTVAADFAMALEARWDSRGAICLNTPRLRANPPPDSPPWLPSSVDAAIAAECSRPPTCPVFATAPHLTSYNPL
jgi:ADYC domain